MRFFPGLSQVARVVCNVFGVVFATNNPLHRILHIGSNLLGKLFGRTLRACVRLVIIGKW